MKSILPNFNCMRTSEVQFSEINLIWSLKYILGRWDGGSVDGGTVDGYRWDGGRCFWKTPNTSLGDSFSLTGTPSSRRH